MSFFDLIKDHRNPHAASGLARLMWDAHGRGSGIEKGVLERFAPEQQTTVYPATALGRELAAVDLDDLKTRRRQLYDALECWLQDLKDANAAVGWATFRRNLISRLEQEFRVTVAETRRPMNDVTMFDQTAASVAMFKAALAQNLFVGWKEPTQTAVADKYKWRILRVGIDGPGFWGRAARLSDLLARKALLAPALDAARTLLEETYPLGMEVYRDENGSLFIVPDMADLLEMTVDGSRLHDHLSKITATALDEEASCRLELSQPTRNMLVLGRLATAVLPEPTPSPQWLQTVWRKDPNDICPVCGLRPQGPGKKAIARKVCDVCEQRRANRSGQWVENLSSTIWTDEVADINGRLALVVGSFGLDPWLGGSAFSSVLMFDPATRQLTDEDRKDKQYDFDYNQLLQDLQQAIRRKQFTGN
ncbi:MAG: CRISPR-associated protein Csx11, partial [Anaerolineae bacterium]